MKQNKIGFEAHKLAGFKAAMNMIKHDTPLTQVYYERMFESFMEGVREARGEFEDYTQETYGGLK